MTFTGRPAEGAAFARRASADIGEGFEDTQRSMLAVETMAYYFGVGGRGGRHRARALPHHDVPPGRGRGCSRRWRPSTGCRAAARTTSAQPWHASRSLGDNRALIELDNGLFTIPAYITLTYTDQPDVLAVWDVALEDAHRRGSLFGLSACEAWRAFTLLYMGELAESVENHDRAYKALRSYGHGDATVVYMVSFHARALIEMGEVREARQVFDRIGDMPGRGDGPRYQAWGRTELLLAEGRADEALAACDEFARRIQPRLVAPSLAAVNSQRARALAALGRREEGIPLVEDELERARRSGAPGAIGRALRVLGELKGDAGVDDLRESVEVLERSLMRARTGQGAGVARRRAAPQPPADRGARAAARGARAGGRLRREAGGRVRATGAVRDRRAPAHRGGQRRRRADRQRAPRRQPGRRGQLEPRHRSGAVRHAEDG